jgi:hypothetical protein
MSLFLKQGKLKSSLFLNAFMLSLAYIVVYVFAYALSARLFEKLLPETTTNALLVWLPPVVICLAASVICALPLLFVQNRMTVILAFAFIAVYAAGGIAFMLSKMPPFARTQILQPLLFYYALPAVLGNAVCWLGIVLLPLSPES